MALFSLFYGVDPSSRYETEKKKQIKIREEKVLQSILFI